VWRSLDLKTPVSDCSKGHRSERIGALSFEGLSYQRPQRRRNLEIQLWVDFDMVEECKKVLIRIGKFWPVLRGC
jgi:hypothetical protein